jgi:predicted small secreted protein
MKNKLIIILLLALCTGFITGCATGRGKRNVGVGISKSAGQKASVSVGASRSVGKHGSVGASRSIR